MLQITGRYLILFAVILILCGSAFGFFFVPPGFYPASEQPFMVRVRLAHDANVLKLGAETGCEIRDAETGELLEKRAAIPAGTKVSPTGAGITLGERVFAARAIRVSPSVGGAVSLDGTAYRGHLDIINKGKELDAVNTVELEDYLKGVLPREVHHRWPFEALKAQAIASRSYAVHEALRRKGKEHDLTDDASTQVYGGRSAERWWTTRAVEATKGKVLEHKGEVLSAYFHSCCGGHTRNVSSAWGTRACPAPNGAGAGPLSGVKCPWCRLSPNFRWQARVSPRAISGGLRERDHDIERVDDVRGGLRDGSGRLEYVKVRCHDRWFEIGTEDLRSVVGRGVLKSAKFHVRREPLYYLFDGRGWGHGVGMCQWGAFALALKWWKAERILGYYYPGAKVVGI